MDLPALKSFDDILKDGHRASREWAFPESVFESFRKLGILQSYNWAAGEGSQINLAKGTMRLGGRSAPKLSWNGVDALSVDGTVIARAGEVGGFTINETDGLYAGAAGTRVQMKAGVGFWAGATAFGDAPFRVDAAGNLVATSATITGAVTLTNQITSADISDVGANADQTSGNPQAVSWLTDAGVLALQNSVDLATAEVTNRVLDNIADGATYGRVLNTDISSGHILLSACTGALDDIDDGTYGKVLSTAISAGNILLSSCSGDLDDIANGVYGKVLSTAILAGKIVLTGGGGVDGVLPVGNTDAKCTDPNADQTSANPQNYSWVTGTKPPADADNTASIVSAMAYESLVEKAKLGTTIMTGGYIRTDMLDVAVAYISQAAMIANAVIGDAHITGTLSVGHTDAKCTDANADQTSANTAAAIAGQGSLATLSAIGAALCDTTIVDGGKIITGLLTADNIQAGTLTGRMVQTDTGAAGHYQRFVVSAADNKAHWYDSSNNEILTVGDAVHLGFGGLKINDGIGYFVNNNGDSFAAISYYEGAAASVGVRGQAYDAAGDQAFERCGVSGAGNIYGSELGISTGVYGSALGGVTARGIWGSALGATTNWAGYFGPYGNVYVANSLSDGSNALTVANAKAAYDHSQITTGNPHSLTLTDLIAYAHASLTGVSANQHHAQSHTVASHSDTSATGAELETLTNGSNTGLHVHNIYALDTDLSTHAALSGNGGHVPSIGSAGQYLKHDGTWGTPPDLNTWRGIDTSPVQYQGAESISSGLAYDHVASVNAHHSSVSAGLVITPSGILMPTGSSGTARRMWITDNGPSGIVLSIQSASYGTKSITLT